MVFNINPDLYEAYLKGLCEMHLTQHMSLVGNRLKMV